MKRIQKRIVVLFLLVSALLYGGAEQAPDGAAGVARLRGAAAHAFLDEAGLLEQLAADSVLAPPQGRTFHEPMPVTATDGAKDDWLGFSIALDGDTAVVGAYGADISGRESQGAAYIFVRSGSEWLQQQKLIAADGAEGDWFGRAVAINGETAVVGAPNAKIGANVAQGAAYVFTRSGSVWSLQKKLVAAGGDMFDSLGNAVALEGDTVLAGAWLADEGAVYVFTRSGGTWSEQQKLAAGDGATGDIFGVAVALDGNTAVIGAAEANIDGKTSQGAAYVFTRSGPTWSEQQKLSASDGAAGHFFGDSVAVDGDTILIGADGAAQGAAYVFTRSGGTWSEQQKLVVANGAANESFGLSVALGGDTAVVGDPNADVSGNTDSGAAYVFTRSGATWKQQQRLTAGDWAIGGRFGFAVALDRDTAVFGAPDAQDGELSAAGKFYVADRGPVSWPLVSSNVANDGVAGDELGYSVALDGERALVGAWRARLGANDGQGAAYLFIRNGPVWVQQQKLVADDGEEYDQFGVSVALDGDTAMVGAAGANIAGSDSQGATYVFERNGPVWIQQQKLIAFDGGEFEYFGDSVALDGKTVVIGAEGAVLDGSTTGAAYVFTHDGSFWTLQQKLVAVNGAEYDWIGSSVALDGETAIIGASGADIGESSQGAAYVFKRSGETWSEQQKLFAADGASGDDFGISVALDGQTAIIGAPFARINGVAWQGAAYIFARSGETWSEGQKLFAPDGAEDAFFGESVAIDGERVLAGARGADIAGKIRQGAAYVFSRSGPVWIVEQKLIAADGTFYDYFSDAVALDGNTALTGAWGVDVNGKMEQGRVYFFERQGSGQTELFLPAVMGS